MDREERRRSARFLEHEFERLDFGPVEDLRGRHGKKLWSPEQFSKAIVAGVVAGRKGFLGVEKLSKQFAWEVEKRLGFFRRLPDTTLRDYVVKADLGGYRTVLRQQARSLYRSKSLSRSEGLPIHMVSVDGKYRYVWVHQERADDYPYFQTVKEPVEDRQKGEVRSITVSLVTSRSTFVLDTIPVRRETNEMGMFPEVLEAILEDWGNTDLPELVAADAGSASLANATLVNEAGLGYLMVLNGFQPELLREAERQLGRRSAEHAEATWEERYQGKMLVYRLWRTGEMADWNGWTHLQQVLRLERREVSDRPEIPDKVGTRYFLSNLPWGRLAPADWIQVIRRRWGVENGAHWTLDKILEEDDHPWTKDPHGMLVLQMLRRIGLNILALHRGVHLRSEENRMQPWKDFLENFHDVLRHAEPQDLLDRRALKRRIAIAA